MKLIVSLLMLCVTTVFAEDVFFYDHAEGELVHRVTNQCYVMLLTAEQQTSPENGDQFEQIMKDLANDPAHTSVLSPALATDFVNDHCRNMELFRITQ